MEKMSGISDKKVGTVFQGDLQRLKVQLEGDFRRSTPRSNMDKAKLLADRLLYLVSGILDSLQNDHKERQITSGNDAPVKNLVDALTKFLSADYARYFPT